MTDIQGKHQPALARPAWLDQLVFDAGGLIPAIAQDRDTGTVLMVAWMNADAVLETMRSGRAVYFSRSRQRLWHKGEQSGHYQQVHEMRLDCDGDVLLLQVSQIGGIACHTGRQHCFYRRLEPGPAGITQGGDGDPGRRPAGLESSGKQHLHAGDTAVWVVTDPVLKDPAEIYSQDRDGQDD